jgi:hypothetical protein
MNFINQTHKKINKSGIWTGIMTVLLLIGCSPSVQKGSKQQDVVARSTMRLAPYPWMGDRQFEETINTLAKYPGVAEDIAFFTEVSGSGTQLEDFKKNMQILSQRMQKVREKGFRPGLNMFVTLGHREENLENSLKGDFQYMVGIDGTVSKGCYCPNDPNYQAYLSQKYQIAAATNPDFIWIDDDVRMSNHAPLKVACFCKHCLDIYEKETGKKYTRESLEKAMNEGSLEEKIKNRKAWLQHNRNTLNNLCQLIEHAVHQTNPAISLGFMSGDRFYDGYDFDHYAENLSGSGKKEVMWRPGGGFYEDYNILELAAKSHAIGRQVSILPATVTSIQSEIENIPCQRLRKASSIVVLEAASHIAAGCTGTTYSILPYYDEPVEAYEPLLQELQKARPFFDLMVQKLGRTPLAGVLNFWNKDICASFNATDGDWFNVTPIIPSTELYEIGLPAAYSTEHANVTILTKDNIAALTPEEIKSFLSGSLYIDGEVLQQLNAQGWQDYTGFELVASNPGDCVERYLQHALNGKYVGRERRSYPRFKSYAFKKTNEKAEALTALDDLSGHELGIGMGIFENKLGGRIAVAGHCPLNMMGNPSKSTQQKSVFRWLSRDQLSGYIKSFHRINLWIREATANQQALTLTNSSFDPALQVELMIRTTKTSLKIYDMNCQEKTISSSGTDGPYQKFIIPVIDPWQIRLAVIE